MRGSMLGLRLTLHTQQHRTQNATLTLTDDD